MNFELLGQDSEPIREWIVPVAVYYPMVRRFAFPFEALAAGTYVLRLTIETDRPDLRADDVLSAPTVSDSVEILVP